MSGAPFFALGLDVGGTKIAGGLVEFPAGIVRLRHTVPTQPERGGAAVLEDVERLAQRLAAEATAVRLEVHAAGLGLCELVSSRGDILSANCVDWRSAPVRERLSAIAPLTLEADVRAAARAEAHFGAGRPFRQFLYVTVGTGIASCLVLDRVPFTGARGATGTMASSPVSVPCEGCGRINRRTIEELASGPALVARYNDFHPGAARTGHEVLAAAAAGDTEASFVTRSAAEALGSAVGLLVNVLDPEAVVVGGGLGLSEGPFWDEFIAATRRHIWSDVHRDLPILRAGTGTDAGLIGAAAAAWARAGR
ncbi:MAG TPA: ROK family protein [Methylomirabilota bacterium]|nr:ROK family protein [Methylomirabilota bacterium]